MYFRNNALKCRSKIANFKLRRKRSKQAESLFSKNLTFQQAILLNVVFTVVIHTKKVLDFKKLQSLQKTKDKNKSSLPTSLLCLNETGFTWERMT